MRFAAVYLSSCSKQIASSRPNLDTSIAVSGYNPRVSKIIQTFHKFYVRPLLLPINVQRLLEIPVQKGCCCSVGTNGEYGVFQLSSLPSPPLSTSHLLRTHTDVKLSRLVYTSVVLCFCTYESEWERIQPSLAFG